MEIIGGVYFDGVICDNGKYYFVDMVVVGIGVEFCIELVVMCGLVILNGVEVNGYM